MKKECEIIRDILPNYIDKTTSNASNKLVEEHIKECKECNNYYLNLKSININMDNKEKRKINGFKIYNRKMKILKMCIVFFIIVILIISLNYVKIYKDKYRKADELAKYISESAELYAQNAERCPEVLYATIDNVISEDVYNSKTIYVTASDINEKKWQGTFKITLLEDSYPKILRNKNEIENDELKIGQKIIIIANSDGVQKIENELPEIAYPEYIVIISD